MSHQLSSATPDHPPVIVGIDWADREHDACVIDDNNGKVQTFKHDPDAIADWFEQLHKKYPDRPILIAIEQSRGALVHALQDTKGLIIYPINPNQLARYREALYPGGGKNDTVDAQLLAMFLANHRQQLRPWKPDDVETRKLDHLSELRRKLVEQRKCLCLQLLGTLKLYFPLVVTLFEKSLSSDLVIDLLKRWPCLAELKKPHPKTLREFFREHGIRDEERQTELVKTIRAASPLTTDPAIIQSYSIFVQSLARQIAETNRAITEFEDELKRVVAKHPDHELFHSLPGAGDALVPRLIAAFGSDRDRYSSASELQAYSGIAPITKQSGQACVVQQRYFCPKFLKQTFHEFADHARKWSTWSRAFYLLKRSKGMKHNAAVRALAFKWIRIIFSLWKSKEIYSEEKYLNQLRSKNSPLLAFIQET